MFPLRKAVSGGVMGTAGDTWGTNFCLLNTKVQEQGSALYPDPTWRKNHSFRGCFLGLCQ